MPYSTAVADLLAGQLSRLVTLNRHQLAGQAANLPFWLAEVAHAFEVIDRYGERFVRLEAAQEAYTTAHGTKEFHLPADEFTHRGVRAQPPKRVPDNVLRKSRRALADATHRFLSRCLADGLVTDHDFRQHCDQLGLAADAGRPAQS